MRRLAAVALLASLSAARAEAADNPPHWQIVAGGLSYMPDESDFSLMDLECAGGRLVVSVPVADKPGAAAFGSVAVNAGAVARRYPAKVLRDESGTWLEFRTSPRDPAMLAFRVTGRISVDGEPDLAARNDGERAAIVRFFEACH
jgi:hypothetical protein